MVVPARIARSFAPVLRNEGVREAFREADIRLTRLHHSLAERWPGLIRPNPKQLTVAVTSHCNLRCRGCHYGRGFMQGEQLDLATLRDALDDAWEAGVEIVRLYGGEPLLHKDLPAIVRHATDLGLRTYVTTNGTLLKLRFDELHAAGLRLVTVGFYGFEEAYDGYVQRGGHFARLRNSLEYVRSRYDRDEVEIQLNFVLMKPWCSPEAVRDAWRLAVDHDLFFHVDLVSFSTPFFNNDPALELQFSDGDAGRLREVAAELEALKRADPRRMVHSLEFLRSIPDWLLLKERMRVPCDAYELVWIGADGTVQLCDVTFPLGNLKRQRLREILFSEAHVRACRDGFALKCPNCTCKVDPRIRKHAASVRRYGAGWEAPCPT